MSRHGSIAEQLKGILAYRERPELDEPIVPIKTNWSTSATGTADKEDLINLAQDRKRIVTPSVAEIIRQVEKNEVEVNHQGQVVAIGSLRFSDGTQTEQAHRRTVDGKLERYMARMPTGAMLNTRDTSDVALGSGAVDHGGSNSFFQEVFKTQPHKYRKSGKRRKGRNFSSAEARAMLDEAITNTPIMPPIKYYPDGLPYGTARVGDNFLGMKKTTKGNGGSIAWQDLSTLMSERESWAAVMTEIGEEKSALDTAMNAKKMSDIGASAGFFGKKAERRGKRSLIAANDNLMQAIKKAAA